MTALFRRRTASTLHIVPTAAALMIALLPAGSASASDAVVPAADAAKSVYYTAAVDSDGTLLRGHHVVSSARTDPGRYLVTFDADVSACAYIATITDDASIGAAPQTARAKDTPNAIVVETKTLATTLWDSGFSLDVRCAPSDKQFAVVSQDGVLARGVGGTDVTHPATGIYHVTFDRRITDCAYTATIGSTDATPVADTGLVFAATKRNRPKTVALQVEDHRGRLADLPVHLAITCGDSAARPWGVIDDIGTRDRGSGILGTEVIRDGATNVTARTSGRNCTYTASIGSPSYDRMWQPGLVKLALDDASKTETTVQLRMSNLSQGQVSYPVHLVLVC